MDLKEDFTLIKSSLVHLHSDSDLPIFHSINDFCHSFIIASNLFQKRCDRIKKEKSKKKKNLSGSFTSKERERIPFPAAGQQFDPIGAIFGHSFFPQNLTYPIEIYYFLVGH